MSEGMVGNIDQVPDFVRVKEGAENGKGSYYYRLTNFHHGKDYMVWGLFVFRPVGGNAIPIYLLEDDEGALVLRSASLFKISDRRASVTLPGVEHRVEPVEH